MVLGDSDFTRIKKLVRSTGLRDDFRAMSLTKAQLKAGLQAMEDWFVGGFSSTPTESMVAAIEAQTGTLTASQRKAFVKVWAAWRIGQVW